MARRPPSGTSRSSREDWLEEGLALLRAEGDGVLTVDVLCRRMARTKGSFYHHFADRDDFVRRMLEHWEESFTGRVIEDLEPIADPRERLRILGVRTAREVDLDLERTLRIWGDREPAAREVVERVDRRREEYLREQIEEATGDPRRARLAARAQMALLVGTEMLYRDLPPDELDDLHAWVGRLGTEGRGLAGSARRRQRRTPNDRPEKETP